MTRYLALADPSGILRLDLDGDFTDELGEQILDNASGNAIVAFFNGMDINFAGTSEVIVQDDIELASSSGGTIFFSFNTSLFTESLTFLSFEEISFFSATYGLNVTFGELAFVQGFHRFQQSATFLGVGINAFDARMIFDGAMQGDVTYNSTLTTDYLLFNDQLGGNIYNYGSGTLDVFVFANGVINSASALPQQIGGTGAINLVVNGTIANGFTMGSGDDTFSVSTAASLFTTANGQFLNTAAGDDTFDFSSGTWGVADLLFMDTGDDEATIGTNATFWGALIMGAGDDTVTVDGTLGSSSQKATVNMGTSDVEGDAFTATNMDVYADVSFDGDGTFSITNLFFTGTVTSSTGSLAVTMANSSQFGGPAFNLGSGADVITITDSTLFGGVNTSGGADDVTVTNTIGTARGSLGTGQDRLTVQQNSSVSFDLNNNDDVADIDNSVAFLDMGGGNDRVEVGESSTVTVAGGAGVDSFIFDGTQGYLTITDWEDGEEIEIRNIIDQNAILRIIIDGDLETVIGTGTMRGNGNRTAIDMNVSLFSESIDITFTSTAAGFSLGPDFAGLGLSIEGDIGNFDLDAFSFTNFVLG